MRYICKSHWVGRTGSTVKIGDAKNIDIAAYWIPRRAETCLTYDGRNGQGAREEATEGDNCDERSFHVCDWSGEQLKDL